MSDDAEDRRLRSTYPHGTQFTPYSAMEGPMKVTGEIKVAPTPPAAREAGAETGKQRFAVGTEMHVYRDNGDVAVYVAIERCNCIVWEHRSGMGNRFPSIYEQDALDNLWVARSALSLVTHERDALKAETERLKDDNSRMSRQIGRME